jgi:hypothetical protein
MDGRKWWEIGSLCVLACVALVSRAEAATGPINVTALPAPCTTNAIPNDWGDDGPSIQCAIGLVPPEGGEIRDAAFGFDMVGMGEGNSIANCHIQSVSRGITSYNGLGDLAIANNTIMRQASGTSSAWS